MSHDEDEDDDDEEEVEGGENDFFLKGILKKDGCKPQR